MPKHARARQADKSSIVQGVLAKTRLVSGRVHTFLAEVVSTSLRDKIGKTLQGKFMLILATKNVLEKFSIKTRSGNFIY